jgi:hypothetical protein
MAEEDNGKTIFITPLRTYYYKVMSFDLKKDNLSKRNGHVIPWYDAQNNWGVYG